MWNDLIKCGGDGGVSGVSEAEVKQRGGRERDTRLTRGTSGSRCKGCREHRAIHRGDERLEGGSLTVLLNNGVESSGTFLIAVEEITSENKKMREAV